MSSNYVNFVKARDAMKIDALNRHRIIECIHYSFILPFIKIQREFKVKLYSNKTCRRYDLSHTSITILHSTEMNKKKIVFSKETFYLFKLSLALHSAHELFTICD